MTFGSFPKTHLAVAAALGLLLLILTLTLPGSDKELAAQGEIGPDESETTDDKQTIAESAGTPAVDSDPADGTIEATVAHDGIRKARVQNGDSLALIFKREGLSSGDLHRLATSTPLGKRLRAIKPGDDLLFTTAADNSLERFEYVSSPLSKLVFERDGDRFVSQEVTREPDRITSFKQGSIEDSLFLASQRAGLNDAMTMRLAQIFQWDIDFVLDIRRGDEFAVLFEDLYVDGKFVGHGNILAAEFVNRGRAYKAIRYTSSDGDTHYYSPEGRPMRQAFLRAPVEFSRISSNFNLKRRHPLFNRSMPHRGIDYSAPTGTPILAAGDGRVVTASRTAPNGNYLVVQHGSQVTTKYLHMTKFGPNIRQGVRVKQGQVIGYVGSTGWATGPHLHYEFLVNGVHQNPRTVKLPQADPIPRTELAKFKAQSAPLLALLDSHRQQQQIALAQ